MVRRFIHNTPNKITKDKDMRVIAITLQSNVSFSLDCDIDVAKEDIVNPKKETSHPVSRLPLPHPWLHGNFRRQSFLYGIVFHLSSQFHEICSRRDPA